MPSPNDETGMEKMEETVSEERDDCVMVPVV
jgi:hypothetical protein